MKEVDIRSKEIEKIADEHRKIDLQKIIFHDDGTDFLKTMCPACKKNEYVEIYKIDGFTYCLCGECDTVFVNPRPPEETLLRWYTESEYNSKIRFQNLQAHREQRYTNIILPRIRSFLDKLPHFEGDVNILDIGSGDGSTLKAFDALLSMTTNVFLHGLELQHSDYLLTENITMHYGDLSSLRFEANFNIVCCIELIEHVFDPEKLLRQIYGIMQRGGYLYLSTPNWLGADFQFIGPEYRNLRAPTHIQFFNPNSIRHLLECSGFSVLYVDTPGLLDVDLIMRYSKKKFNEETSVKNRIMDFFISDEPQKISFRNDLQLLLQKYNLSGSMRCIAKKK